MRRACNKNEGKAQAYKAMIRRYAEKQMVEQTWPIWFQPTEGTAVARPTQYPIEQPHPTTKEHDERWDEQITPFGLIGLLIESITWHGLVIDEQLRIWQSNEEPIDIIAMPFQRLKVMINSTGARARSRAEWMRQTSRKMPVREIDRTASQVGPNMKAEDKSYARTAMMGSTLGKSEVAEFNEDVDATCDYCFECPATVEHIRWQCKFFEPQRVETDRSLAAIPRRYLPACVQCAIGPVMKVDGTKTFWGQEVEDDEKAEVKKMLMIDLSLYTPGDNAEKTEEKEAAVEIIERMNDQRKNARQTM